VGVSLNCSIYYNFLRELRRIHLPRTQVNKGKKDKKGRGMITQMLASSKWHQVGLRKLEEPRASPVLLCLSSNGYLTELTPAESVL
jgi:hypothetical protein